MSSQMQRITFNPVSYTHLDVYKRQALRRALKKAASAVGVGKQIPCFPIYGDTLPLTRSARIGDPCGAVN